MLWLAFALGCAILAGLASVLSKEALTKESAIEFSTALAMVNVVVSIPLIYWIDLDVSVFLLGIIFFAALTSAGGFLLTAKALKHMDISIVSPMRNFSPAFTAFFAIILLSEQLSFMHIGGITILVLGSYVLEINFKKHDIFTPFKKVWKSKYLHLLFLSLVIYAISSVAGKYALSFSDPITLLFLIQLFISIIFIFYVSLRRNGPADIKAGFRRAGWIIAVIAVLTVSYRVLQWKAMALQYVSLVIPIKRLSTLFSTVIGGEFFNEEGLLQKAVACVIMILGAALIALG